MIHQNGFCYVIRRLLNLMWISSQGIGMEMESEISEGTQLEDYVNAAIVIVFRRRGNKSPNT